MRGRIGAVLLFTLCGAGWVVASTWPDVGGGFATAILDGLIVDADVNAAANITATKLGTGAVSNTELNLLDGHAAALVDTDDAVATAITGTGALGAGSIAAGFGAIDNGADAITTTGTVSAGSVTVDSAAGTNSSFTETGVDRNSASAETWTVTNSGAGDCTLTPDALNVVGATTMGGTVTHNAVATDVACGAGETWTNTCTNATFSTGKLTVPTIATTISDFLMSSRSDTAGLAMTTGGAILATIVPAQSLTITRIVISIVAGAGTGSQVITFTDGTNTCTCTVACPYTTTSISCVAGAGTGCVYAPGAISTGTVTTQCTGAQPSARSIAAYALKN